MYPARECSVIFELRVVPSSVKSHAICDECRVNAHYRNCWLAYWNHCFPGMQFVACHQLAWPTHWRLADTGNRGIRTVVRLSGLCRVARNNSGSLGFYC